VPQTLPNPSAQVNGAIRTSAASSKWDAPAPLRLWHLTSLDAPTVAVVWSLAFASAAKVSLPVWIPLFLALAAWSAYIADRLLDARTALRTGNLKSLRQRHWFHHRHRRVLGPLAISAACAAACVVVSVMPVAARERNSVLAVAALAYFTRVHSSRQVPGVGLSSLVPFFKKEMLVGLLFTSACALPALSRALAQTSAPIWPLLPAAVFFAMLAWLNCHAIERWETDDQAQHSSVFHLACLLALAGLLLASLTPNPQSHRAALVIAGAASALLLALLDRLRDRLTPLALRVSADLVLLTPLALLVR
jgi:hypothetical protein